MPTSLPDPKALRNLKYINPILRNCNFQEARLKHFWVIFRIFPQNQAKMLQSCFLWIAISQDWVDVFQISQSLWVRQAYGHILKLSRFHNSCKQNFCVTKCPKIVQFVQFHNTGTVGLIGACKVSYVQMNQPPIYNFSNFHHRYLLTLHNYYFFRTIRLMMR